MQQLPRDLELQPVVNEIVGFRTKSQNTRLSILKDYVRWCIKNQIGGACDELFQIEELGLDKLKRQMVANPQHLQRYLNCICEAESEETVDCIYRCFYWLAYGGMQEEDVFDVTVQDVDLVDMIVRHGEKEYPIYREAIPAFKNCVTLTQFRYKHTFLMLEAETLRLSIFTCRRVFTISRSFHHLTFYLQRLIISILHS